MIKNALDEQYKAEIIQEISKLLKERYIFPKVAQKIIEEFKADFKNGEYDDIKDLPSLAIKIGKTLQEVSQDKHLCVLFDQGILERMFGQRNKKDEKTLEYQKEWQLGRSLNYGFVKVEILEGNIGLIDLRRFYHTKHQEAGEAALSAMSFLKNTEAIILDLRKNGGGEPEMVQLLASYFFKNRTRLNTIERPYEGYKEQWWTFPYIPGKPLVENDLYILTSNITFSAAEDFTYALQCQNRATVIGETTKGGAHPVDFFPVLGSLVLMLPNARAFNTITNDNWEGKGIEPDIKVSSEEALDTAYLFALEKLLKTKKMNENDHLCIKILIKELELIKSMKQSFPSISILSKYVGNYEKARIELRENELYYVIDGTREIKLIPLTDEVFEPEGNPNERV
ncbi:MAG: S41 family peptidase, partial [Candidatus Hodarchaeota archaeon]